MKGEWATGVRSRSIVSGARKNSIRGFHREEAISDANVSYSRAMITGMEVTALDEAIELLEKANAGLEPELLPAAAARRLLAA